MILFSETKFSMSWEFPSLPSYYEQHNFSMWSRRGSLRQTEDNRLTYCQEAPKAGVCTGEAPGGSAHTNRHVPGCYSPAVRAAM